MLSMAIGALSVDKGGTLQRDEVWSGEVHVTNYVFVPKEITLTIEPGTVIKFQHYRGYKEQWRRTGLTVNGGSVKAVGTSNKQIWFTSDVDDPINGDWEGISLYNTKDSEFSYVIVEFGEMGIEQFDSEVTVSNSIIRWNNAEGLYGERSKPIFEFNTLYENGYHEIALEQYNEAQVLHNIIKDGHAGFHCQKTTAYLEGNYFKNERDSMITAGMDSNITVVGNRFENTGTYPPIRVSSGSTAKTENNDYGQGTVPIPRFDYEDTKHFKLGYVPGDSEDRYLYVYDEVDQTRRTIKKIGQGLSFGWALVYAEKRLWRFSLGRGEIGTSLDFIEMDPDTGGFKRYGNNEVMNPRGLTYDGKHFWVNDFSLLRIFEFELQAGFVRILKSFDIPEKSKGGTSGLTSDGQFLYLRSRDGSKLYRLDMSGNVVGEIPFRNRRVGGALVWTGSYFWTNRGCPRGLCKWTKDGKPVGEIYPPAKDTWALAWDGKYLWSIQRTCEMWDDPKVYQIEILDDSVAGTPFDYSLMVSPSTQTVELGKTVSYMVTVLPASGKGTVSLSVGGLPQDIGRSFTVQTGSPPFTSRLVLDLATSTSTGTYTITIVGTNTGETKTATATLTVTENTATSQSVTATTQPQMLTPATILADPTCIMVVILLAAAVVLATLARKRRQPEQRIPIQ